MKRFHIHVRVADLAASVVFYGRLFGAGPSRLEEDYAKWMLEDPRVNVAISTRGEGSGLDHLGFQVDEASELAALRERAEAAELTVLPHGEMACCYSRSEKHWVTDPQGIAWEHFHTLGDVPVYGDGRSAQSNAACCAPVAPDAGAFTTRARSKSSCC